MINFTRRLAIAYSEEAVNMSKSVCVVRHTCCTHFIHYKIIMGTEKCIWISFGAQGKKRFRCLTMWVLQYSLAVLQKSDKVLSRGCQAFVHANRLSVDDMVDRPFRICIRIHRYCCVCDNEKSNTLK